MHTSISYYKNREYCLALFILWAIPIFLFAQKPMTVTWENKLLSNNGFRQAIINNEGNIVAVGSTTKAYGKDIAVSIINQAGTLLKDTSLVGGVEDDVINAFVQTDDGGYLMVGYTESPLKGFQGKRDAWIVKTDENAKPLWHKLYGTPENDAYNAVLADTEGDGFYVGGTMGTDFTLTKIDNTGGKLIAKTLKSTNAQATTLLYNKDKSRLFLVGTEKKNQGIVYCFDRDGNEVWKKVYPNAILNAAALDKSGHLLVAGMTFSQRTFEEMLLLVINPTNGEEKSRKSFGGNGADEAFSIAQNTEGGIYMAGYSTSKTRGERYEDLCLIEVDTNDVKQKWQNVIYNGGKTEDAANDMLIAPDGSLIIVGHSDKKGWILNYGKVQTVKADTYSLLLSDPIFNDADVNGVLNQDERAYASFWIENKSSDILGNIALSIKQIEGKEPIIFPQNIVINQLEPGTKKRIVIPFNSPNLQTDSIRLNTSVNTFAITLGGDTSKTKAIRFSTMKKREPKVVVIGNSFAPASPSYLQRKIETTLTFFIQNIGDTTAENLTIQCFLPSKVEKISNMSATLEQINAGEQQEVAFKFKITANFTDSILKTALAIDGHNIVRGATHISQIPVQSFEAYEQEQQKTTVFISKTSIFWITPDLEDKRSNYIEANEPKYTVKVKAESTHPLTEKDFKVIVNGEPLMGGVKLDNVKLKSNTNNQTNSYRYNYTTTVDLIGDTTKVEIEVINQGGKSKTEPLYFIYNSRPNLHILAIGVPDNNKRLKYPPKDAADLATAFSKQQGILFKNVTVTLLNTEVQTTAKNLGKELADLPYKFSDNEIRPQDVLMIVISSHGQTFTDKNKQIFCLLASDYESMSPYHTTIDFERDVLGQTASIDCKKLLLIDACQSGQALEQQKVSGEKSAEEISPYEAINQLMKAKAGLRYIVSCKGNESSYEDDAWQNGAFTKAILEGLRNETTTTIDGKKSADRNKDAVLSFVELAEYAQIRVPQLVKDKKKRDQHPISSLNGSDDFPIFLLKK